MCHATFHACVRVEQRLGFVPDDEDWLGVLMAITDTVVGKPRALMLRQHAGIEIWLVPMRDMAARVVWNPETAVVVTVLPAVRG
jgi:hypothetical protein